MSERGIDHVALIVRDLPVMAEFYERIIGLVPLAGDGSTRRLGSGDRTLVELRSDPSATGRDPRQPGLFHTAFLLPSRADLGGWIRHAADAGMRLTGASDHGVSEALYLDDPEGNGIEIYYDRPETHWKRDGARVEMLTLRLDLDDLASAATTQWRHAPEGSRIGHVHLQVGDLLRADGFLAGDLGMTQTFEAPGGAWYGWDGYHHHLAGNIWNSRGVRARDAATTGLAEVVLNSPERSGEILTDPWGTAFRFA